MKLFVLIVFILVYVLILAFPKYKVFSAEKIAILKTKYTKMLTLVTICLSVKNPYIHQTLFMVGFSQRNLIFLVQFREKKEKIKWLKNAYGYSVKVMPI